MAVRPTDLSESFLCRLVADEKQRRPSGDQFPALWDYYAATASANDSFVAGVGGGGYVFLSTLSDPQFRRYARRVGRLLRDYGPSVVDTYGFASPELLQNYSAEAAAGGGRAPSAYISEPTHWGFWDQIPGKPIMPYTCSADNQLLGDGLDVGQTEDRVDRCLDVNEPGVVLNRVRDICRITRIYRRNFHAEARQRVPNKLGAARILHVANNQVVAGG